MTGHARAGATDAVKGKVFEVVAHNSNILVLQTHAGMDLDNGHLEDSYLEKGHLENASTTYGAFNLGLHVNDDPKTVLQHRGQLLGFVNDYLHTHKLRAEHRLTDKIVTDISDMTDAIEGNNPLAATIDSIYWLNQVHGNRVVTVSDTPVKKPLITSMPPMMPIPEPQMPAPKMTGLTLTAPDADAIVTALPRTALAIMTADCVPIVLYAASTQNINQSQGPKHQQPQKPTPEAQIAAIHAGWKGLANGVIAKTYESLMINSQLEGTQTNNNQSTIEILAWIGASIGPACYEVSLAVVAQLLLGCQQLGMATDVIEQQVVGNHDDPKKAWLDLPLLAKLQLDALGVQVMSSTPACSYSDSRYYSYRRMSHRQQSYTGRMALLIMRLDE